MIVDQFYPGGSEKPHVYTRYRDDDDLLIEHIDSGFKPYFGFPKTRLTGKCATH